MSAFVRQGGKGFRRRHRRQEGDLASFGNATRGSNIPRVVKRDALRVHKLCEPFLIVFRITLDAPDAGEFLSFRLAVVKDGASAETQQDTIGTFGIRLDDFFFPYEGRKDENAFLSLANMTVPVCSRCEILQRVLRWAFAE